MVGDAGMYKCVLEDEEGNRMESACNVHVLEKKEDVVEVKSPEMIETSTPQSQVVHEKVESKQGRC